MYGYNRNLVNIFIVGHIMACSIFSEFIILLNVTQKRFFNIYKIANVRNSFKELCENYDLIYQNDRFYSC